MREHLWYSLEDDSVLELWHTTLDKEFNIICKGEKPIVQGTYGQPLCFSYSIPNGDSIPPYIIVCRKSNGVASSWVPGFNEMDGSLKTDSDFIDGEPKG